MLLLIIAIAALVAGVLALPLVRRRAGLLAGLDGFVAVFVGGLVALHVLPESVEAGGVWALVAGVLGLALPMAVHGLQHHRVARDHETAAAARPWLRTALYGLAALGLAAHAMVDGLALASAAASSAHAHAGHGHAGDSHDVVLAASGGVLGLAVLAHKLPTGLALGRIVERVAGLRTALCVALGAGAATVAGFAAASAGVLGHDSVALAVFNALVAGSLLHVVTGHAASNDVPSSPRTLLAGGALAALLLGLVLREPLAPLALLALAPLVWGRLPLAGRSPITDPRPQVTEHR